jgi:hypothetical protein
MNLHRKEGTNEGGESLNTNSIRTNKRQNKKQKHPFEGIQTRGITLTRRVSWGVHNEGEGVPYTTSDWVYIPTPDMGFAVGFPTECYGVVYTYATHAVSSIA